MYIRVETEFLCTPFYKTIFWYSLYKHVIFVISVSTRIKLCKFKRFNSPKLFGSESILIQKYGAYFFKIISNMISDFSLIINPSWVYYKRKINSWSYFEKIHLILGIYMK